MGEHRADHEQHPTGGSHRHHYRCDVEDGGQNQSRRCQELEDAEALGEAATEVLGPFSAMTLGQFLLGYEGLADAADQSASPLAPTGALLRQRGSGLGRAHRPRLERSAPTAEGTPRHTSRS